MNGGDRNVKLEAAEEPLRSNRDGSPHARPFATTPRNSIRESTRLATTVERRRSDVSQATALICFRIHHVSVVIERGYHVVSLTQGSGAG